VERKSEVGGKEGAQDNTEAQRPADKSIARVTNHMGLDSGNEGDDNDLQESSDYLFLTQTKTGQQPPKYRLPTANVSLIVAVCGNCARVIAVLCREL
jgi:hypothetical protein